MLSCKLGEIAATGVSAAIGFVARCDCVEFARCVFACDLHISMRIFLVAALENVLFRSTYFLV